VHHHLIREGLRTSTGLVVETGEAREVHHFCVLAGYGAEAVNPYLAFETLNSFASNTGFRSSLMNRRRTTSSRRQGILKVISRWNITYQILLRRADFRCVGSRPTSSNIIHGTASTSKGWACARSPRKRCNSPECLRENPSITKCSMSAATMPSAFAARIMPGAGIGREAATCRASNSSADYRDYAEKINDQTERLLTLRDDGIQISRRSRCRLTSRTGAEIVSVRPRRHELRLDQPEAAHDLAIAMNRIGGKSNTGEGARKRIASGPLPNGDSMRSAIKQVASGVRRHREYLVNADTSRSRWRKARSRAKAASFQVTRSTEHRSGPARDAGRRADLAAAASHIYSIEDLASSFTT